MREEKFVDKALKWYEEEGKDFPWRADERSPYEVLITEVLLRRTTSTHVEKIYHKFLDRYDSPERLAEAETSELAEVPKPLGLQNQRAEQLKKLGAQLEDIGKIPKDRNELKNLEGVGNYAADATRCFAYGVKTPIIDSNVRRVFKHYFDITEDKKIRHKLSEMLPEDRYRETSISHSSISAPKYVGQFTTNVTRRVF